MKYPFVRQRGERDCGPATVLMILKYYGGYVSLEKLSEALCVNRNGTTFYHIVLALRSYGFESDGYKYDNISSVKTPFIAHINSNSYNHYVVVWKINREKVLVGNPSKGNVWTGLDEFLACWTGNVVTAFPRGKIVNEGKPKILKFLFKLIKPCLSFILPISFLSFIIVILSLILSFSVQLIINYFASSFIISILFFITIITVLNIVFNYLRNVLLIKFGHALDKSLSVEVFSRIIKLPYKVCRRKTTGEITSYFNDLLMIKNVFSKAIISLFLDFPIIISVLIYFIYFNIYIFFISLLIIVLYFVLWRVYKKKIYYLADESLRNKASLNSYITESIMGIETIHNLGIQGKFLNNFREKYENYFLVSNRYDKTKNIIFILNSSVHYLSNLCIFFYGAFNLKNNLTVSNFFTIYVLFSMLNNSFQNLLSFDFEFKDVLSSIYHIYDLFGDFSKNVIKINGDIDIFDLRFSFDKVKPVINGINLNIIKGSKIFVTGESGSGKSTLFKIIKGYYDGYDGSVSIGGIEVKNYVFKNVVYVSSFETLFTGNLKDNLSLRRYDRLNNIICEMEGRDDSLVLENGFNFSSGQRQRIVLSRALACFDILIIDEGLADVDVNMERRIIKNLFLTYKDKTIIFISHRLDNLDLFDRFIKIDDGKVVIDEMRA